MATVVLVTGASIGREGCLTALSIPHLDRASIKPRAGPPPHRPLVQCGLCTHYRSRDGSSGVVVLDSDRLAVGREVWRSRRGHVPGQPASNDSEEAAQHHVDLLDAGLHLDSPISQPTEMSYFLQRLRLAEIPRGIVDHTPMAVTSAGGASYYTHVTAIDFELDQMIHDIPSFFHLDTYKCSSDSTTSGIFIQAYLPSSVIHTQRCKLYLTYSRILHPDRTTTWPTRPHETCLKSARQLIRAEAQLERAQHPFVQM
ncbi:hypothetical protein COH20_012724 [Aspergillus flavus]|nr:hypothetical protein COH20_012724 [Aspergillus flavus]RAQ71674.1 hypothetical protein COH21_011988 [Aspergillus flavus]